MCVTPSPLLVSAPRKEHQAQHVTSSLHLHCVGCHPFYFTCNCGRFTSTLVTRRKRPSHSEYKAWRASSEVRLPRSRVDVDWYFHNALPVLEQTGKLVLRFFHWHLPENLPHELQVSGRMDPVNASLVAGVISLQFLEFEIDKLVLQPLSCQRPQSTPHKLHVVDPHRAARNKCEESVSYNS